MNKRTFWRQRLFVAGTILVLGIPWLTANAQVSCGTPVIVAGEKTAMHIWRDCPDNVWHVRFGSNGGYKFFTGSVESVSGFTWIAGVELEPADTLDFKTNPLTASFGMGLVPPWEDGFDLSLPNGTSACFRLDSPNDAQILLGSAQTPVFGDFDSETLGACSSGSPIVLISIDDLSVSESAGTANVTVRSNIPAPSAISVSYQSENQSAIAGEDYESAAGTATIQAGQSTTIIPVSITNDTAPEGPEHFFINLDTPTNANVRDAQARITIQDDEETPVCGSPSIDPAVEAAMFLWKDCQSGAWNVRFVAGGRSWTQYKSTIRNDNGFIGLNPIDIERNDRVDNFVDPNIIDIVAGVSPPWTDGLIFTPTNDAGTCIELSSPGDLDIRVGPKKTVVAGPFDIDTLGPCQSAPPAEPTDTYNILVVFTDDQRFDTLAQLPNINSRLIPNGVMFENAYVPTPLCCPARVSTYTGGYLAQNTGVLENKPPNGGNPQFVDTVNIGTNLQAANYHTMFIGKWQNDYPLLKPYVPPGWNTFAGRAVWAHGTDWSSFKYLIGSSGENAGTGSEVNATGQYHVYFERDQILSFLDNIPGGKPFMVFWATSPPHPPATPDGQDAKAFSDFTYRDRGYTETDFSDKPPWVQKASGNAAFNGDEAVRDQLRSLLSVDRGLAAILDKLEAQQKLHKTVIIFTSDNGYMWGEHKLWGKNFAYEESIRVPMLVVAPGISPRIEDKLVSAILDLGPTLYDIAGLPNQNTDGTSLWPLLEDENTPWRNELYFEKYSQISWPNGLWDGLRRDNWKYVRYWTGDEELYDLNADPFELYNQAGNPNYASTLASMASRAAELRGLAIKPNFGMPNGKVATDYSNDFQPWGGKAPFIWKVETGSLPPGLTLNTSNGDLSGKPTSTGSWKFSLRVTDSVIASQAQKPRTFVSGEFTIVVTN